LTTLDTTDRTKIKFISIFLVSKLLFDFTYYYHITELWSYQGLINNFSFFTFLFTCIITLFLATIIKIQEYSLSNFFLLMCVSILFLPAATLFTFGAIKSTFFLLWTAIFIVLIGMFNKKIDFNNNIKISYESILTSSPETWPYFLFMAISLMFFTIFGTTINFNLFNLLGQELYIAREDVAVLLSDLGLVNYIISNTHNVLLPFLLGYSLFYRKFLLIFLTIILYVYLFLVTSYKMILFAPILILVSYFVLFRKESNFKAFTLTYFKYLITFLFISIVIDMALEYSLINILVIRRMFFLPVLISEKYYEYFSINGFTYFSDVSIFSNLSLFPFKYDLPAVIGGYYFAEGNWANTNFLADSYTKLGIFSSLLYIIIIRIFMALIDFSGSNKPHFISYSCVIIPLVSLTNSSLTTTIFTHGLLGSLLLIFFIRK
tara:strand:+ start:963 stop:2261 length:1299 start_codon:yes stop_codon:yes gene_type:complete